MPNLKPPVTTTAAAAAYRERILAALPAGQPLRAADDAVPDGPHRPAEIARAARQPHRASAASSTRPARRRTRTPASPTSAASMRCSRAWPSSACRCWCTAKSPSPEVDVFDREARFIDEVLAPLHERLPSLRDRASSTSRPARPCSSCAARAAASRRRSRRSTCTMNRNALFSGGIRPHHYCLPVLKRESDRVALLRGRDQRRPALLPRHRQRAARRAAKEAPAAARACSRPTPPSNCTPRPSRRPARCRGWRTSPRSSARDFYGLPRNEDIITLERRDLDVPPPATPIGGDVLVPLRAGEALAWRVID